MNKLCECGCGEEVTINQHTRLPNRFIRGHHFRIKNGWNKGMIVSAETRSKLSKAIKGRKLSEETKRKMSLSAGHPAWNKGLKNCYSEETQLKRSISLKRRKISEETKSRMSISAIKRISRQSFNGEPTIPSIGRNETPILNRIQTESNEEILRNDYNLSMISGKFPDGYISKYNLCLDVLEPWHFKANGELSDYDQTRQTRIAWKMRCMIYYIPEQEFLVNPEKEIQRFKDFLLILQEGPN